MKAVWFLLLMLCASTLGCERKGEPQEQAYQAMPAASAQSVSAHAASPLTQAAQGVPAQPPSSDVIWDAPSAWQSVPVNNSMRKATYRIARIAGDIDDAELAVFHFGAGQGGSIDANVDRWLKQFSGIEPRSVKREQRTANGLRQHVVRVDKANYSSGMPGGPLQQKANWGLIGAIVETSNGPYFFKLTGPTATLRATEKTFYGFLDSVKAKP